jgi:membrane protein YdbS with pleckstrin-like domain
MTDGHFPFNTPFKPSPSMVTWFRVDFLLFIAFLLITTYAPIILFGELPFSIHIWVLSGFVISIILFFAWAGLYYQSMWYELREDEISWKRGIWFRKTGIVPYNRITNLDIRQGPVMRALEISTLSIQTAGYSGQAIPEIRIEAIVHAEELRELIRSMVRSSSRGDDGTGTGTRAMIAGSGTAEVQILEELRKIRGLLEKGR